MSVICSPKFCTGSSFNPQVDMRGCVFYAPLWNPRIWGSPFKTLDPSPDTCTVTGALNTYEGSYFDGSDDQIACGNATDLQGAGVLTVSVWVKAAAADGGNNHYVVSKGNAAADGFHLIQRDDNTWTVFSGTASKALTAPVVGQWIHIVLRDDTGNLIVYINGSLYDSAVASGRVANTNLTLRLGKYSAGNNLPFNGTIGEAIIYNRSLDVSELKNLYSSTKWRYH